MSSAYYTRFAVNDETLTFDGEACGEVSDPLGAASLDQWASREAIDAMQEIADANDVGLSEIAGVVRDVVSQYRLDA